MLSSSLCTYTTHEHKIHTYILIYILFLNILKTENYILVTTMNKKGHKFEREQGGIYGRVQRE